MAASCQAGVDGGLGGELSHPRGVGADPAGNVYVVDNQRIQKFDSSGNWERAWGKDVDTGGGMGFELCTVAASCKQGAVGELGGELNFPSGVAADATGNVYVAENFNQRVQKYPPQPSAPSAICRGKQATLVGSNGADQISGTPGADVIVGLGGNDKLSGLGGNDVICGAKGNDTLKGGKGKDILLGQKGDDKLKGAGGNDKLSGKKGKDTLKGGAGKDKLKGGGGEDLCKGGKGEDTASKCEVEKSI